MVETIELVIRKGRAYIPVTARWGKGAQAPYVCIPPVLVTNLDLQSLTQACEQVIAVGHPCVPWWKTLLRQDPVLSATGVKNFQTLAKDSARYIIFWKDDHVLVCLHDLDKHGRFFSGPDRMLRLGVGTPLPKLIESIIDDIQTLPDRGFVSVVEG